MNSIDTTAAVLVAALIYVFVDFSKDITNAVNKSGGWNAVITHLYAWGAGVAGTWLISTTVWAHAPVVGTIPLDHLNSGSKIVAGVLVSSGASAGYQIFGSSAKKLIPGGGSEETPS